MTTSVPSRLAELSARLPALCAEARERAPEFEQARQLSGDFAAQLADAGLFRLLVPTQAGGLGATLPQWLAWKAVYGELAIPQGSGFLRFSLANPLRVLAP